MLPAFVTRPLIDAYADALPDQLVPSGAADAGTSLDSALADGVPARLPLDASRSLVLAVPVGVARVLLDADPLTVVWPSSAERVPVDLPWPRLTLVVDERIADSTAVVLNTRRAQAIPRRILEGGPAA